MTCANSTTVSPCTPSICTGASLFLPSLHARSNNANDRNAPFVEIALIVLIATTFDVDDDFDVGFACTLIFVVSCKSDNDANNRRRCARMSLAAADNAASSLTQTTIRSTDNVGTVSTIAIAIDVVLDDDDDDGDALSTTAWTAAATASSANEKRGADRRDDDDDDSIVDVGPFI